MPRKVLTPPSEKAKAGAANGAPVRGALDADTVTSSEGRGSSFVVDLPAAVLEASRGKPVSQPAGQT